MSASSIFIDMFQIISKLSCTAFSACHPVIEYAEERKMRCCLVALDMVHFILVMLQFLSKCQICFVTAPRHFPRALVRVLDAARFIGAYYAFDHISSRRPAWLLLPL